MTAAHRRDAVSHKASVHESVLQPAAWCRHSISGRVEDRQDPGGKGGSEGGVDFQDTAVGMGVAEEAGVGQDAPAAKVEAARGRAL